MSGCAEHRNKSRVSMSVKKPEILTFNDVRIGSYFSFLVSGPFQLYYKLSRDQYVNLHTGFFPDFPTRQADNAVVILDVNIEAVAAVGNV